MAAARSEEEARARERSFYDAEASAHAAHAHSAPDRYDLALLEALGPVDGLRVLELGCGAGKLSAELVGRGAVLTALDVSPKMVELARGRAPEATFLVAPAERTGLPDGSFDAAVGKGVLHHVDVAAATAELRRVLRPGARAAFFENQDRNAVLRAARRRLWGSPRLNWVGTKDEHALSAADLDALRRHFTVSLSYPSFYFFEAASRAMGHRLNRPLKALDALIWRAVPAARGWGWHALVTLEHR